MKTKRRSSKNEDIYAQRKEEREREGGPRLSCWLNSVSIKSLWPQKSRGRFDGFSRQSCGPRREAAWPIGIRRIGNPKEIIENASASATASTSASADGFACCRLIACHVDSFISRLGPNSCICAASSTISLGHCRRKRKQLCSSNSNGSNGNGSGSRSIW